MKKWILVTGTSTGLGQACAIEFLKHGYGVYAGLRNTNSFPDWTKSFSQDILRPIQLDIEKPSEITAAAQRISRELSGDELVGLINNAGICVAGPLEAISTRDLETQMRVNWLGPIELTQQVFPLLRKSRGRIINVGSAAGRIALPFLGAYASSKFAMEAWSDSLRREVKPQGVGVVLLEIGSISTPIWDKLRAVAEGTLANASDEAKALYGESLQRFLQLNERETAQRKTTPEDVAKTAFEAMTTKAPKARYRIGLDAKVSGLVTGVIPDSWLDRILSKVI